MTASADNGGLSKRGKRYTAEPSREIHPNRDPYWFKPNRCLQSNTTGNRSNMHNGTHQRHRSQCHHNETPPAISRTAARTLIQRETVQMCRTEHSIDDDRTESKMRPLSNFQCKSRTAARKRIQRGKSQALVTEHGIDVSRRATTQRPLQKL